MRAQVSFDADVDPSEVQKEQPADSSTTGTAVETQRGRRLLAGGRADGRRDRPSATPQQEETTLFYSALYRACLFPRQLGETAADGSEVHWSPYAQTTAQRVMPGALSTDSGFWDAWNTVRRVYEPSLHNVRI